MKSDRSPDPLSRMDSFIEMIYEQGDPGQLGEDEPTPLYHNLQKVSQRYLERTLIGRGGMKEVYKVYDQYTARYVAMALPREDLNVCDYDTFLREAHITARLNHPNIINLYDMGLEEDGRPFFTMDFKGGQSLRKILNHVKANIEMGKTSSMNLRQRLDIFLRICEAMSYAHAHHVLHLDLKPENIQLGNLGEVQICDWGLGVVLPKPAGEIETHPNEDAEVKLDPDLYGSLLMRVSGTVGYMAPEQHQPNSPKTRTMDMYAMGQMLFELITLGDIDAPKSRIKNRTLLGIVNKATAIDPQERYQSVNELYQDLIRFQSDLLTSVDRRDHILAARLFYKRHTLTCNIAGLSCLALMTLGTFFKQELQETQAESDKFEKHFIEQKLTREQQVEEQAEEALFLARRLSEDDYIGSVVYQQTILESEMQLRSSLERHPPNDSVAWGKMIWILFLKQDFAEAMNYLEINQNPPKVKPLLKYVRQYGTNMKLGDRLSTQQIISLLHDMYDENIYQCIDLAGRMLIYDTFVGRPQLEYFDIVKTFLSIKNSGWDAHGSQFDPDRKFLRLQGAELKRLCFDIYHRDQYHSALMLLHLEKLDLSQTRLQDLRQLRGVELYELNLSHGLTLMYLEEFKRMPTLRKLILQKGQLSDSQHKELPDFLEVEFKS